MHKLLFPQFSSHKWEEINLNAEARKLSILKPNPLLDPCKCQAWVEKLHKKKKCDYSFGGWLEDRATLWRGHYHQPGHTIHLGIDYNVPAGSAIYLPVEGTLVALEQDPDQNGGWGGRVIFKINDIWVIFAHLRSISACHLGTKYVAGCQLGVVGDHNTGNGGWFPHLHVQCMTNYDRNVDGYAALSDQLALDFPNPAGICGV